MTPEHQDRLITAIESIADSLTNDSNAVGIATILDAALDQLTEIKKELRSISGADLADYDLAMVEKNGGGQ